MADDARDDANAWGAPQAAAIAHAIVVYALAPLERRAIDVLLAARRAISIGGLIDALGSRDLGAALAVVDPGGRLIRYGLARVTGDGPWIARTIALADELLPRLYGHWPRDVPRATANPADALERLARPGAVLARATAIADAIRRRPTTEVVIAGPRGSGRSALAHAIAAAAGLPAIEVRGELLAPDAMTDLGRELLWQQAAIVIEDLDRADPRAIARLDELARIGPVLVTVEPGAEPARGAAPRLRLDVEVLDGPHREAIWVGALAAAGHGERARAELEPIAARYRFGPAEIHAIASAIATGSDPLEARVEAACAAARHTELGGLARRIELAFGWDDLIIPNAVRRELELIVAWGRAGATMFGATGRGANARAPRGMAALFHGAPGTGKTLASQVIAKELGLELFRVELSQVVDKYIGETEKRLDRLFRDAERAGCVLLFDEADTLFARRGDIRDARDRYANLEAGFLLQRLEDHRGITILTSNLQRNIDPAFFRRLAVVATFPIPGPAERARIWHGLLPEPARRGEDVDLSFLADRFELAGGDIRNAVFAAVLLGGDHGAPLGMRELVIAAFREASKAGRLVDTGDLGPWRAALTHYAAAAEPA